MHSVSSLLSGEVCIAACPCTVLTLHFVDRISQQEAFLRKPLPMQPPRMGMDQSEVHATLLRCAQIIAPVPCTAGCDA